MEEIHLIITYPIKESWEKLDMVEVVRRRTISTIENAVKGWHRDGSVEEA